MKNAKLLLGLGISGMITSTVMAVRATPKALYLIEAEKETKEADTLSPLEVVQTVWKCYIPSIITSVLSSICLIESQRINEKRSVALATAYALVESSSSEYQKKVIETIGEKKEQEIQDKIAKDKIENNPVTNREVIVLGKGDTLCYDVVSDRYFRSNMDNLKKAENELNMRLRDEMYISLNDYYYEVGLRGIPIGDDLGWNIDDGWIDLHFSSQLNQEGTPCLVIDYHIRPRIDYR